MKILLIFINIITVAACASTSKEKKVQSLSYKNATQFEIGKNNSDDIIKALGKPSARSSRNGYYVLTYNDPLSGNQRLAFSILNNTNILASILWVPQDNEMELSLENAKANFKEANFKEVTGTNDNPHAPASTVLYMDENLGITILFNNNLKSVQAIGRYDAKNRLPARQIRK